MRAELDVVRASGPRCGDPFLLLQWRTDLATGVAAFGCDPVEATNVSSDAGRSLLCTAVTDERKSKELVCIPRDESARLNEDLAWRSAAEPGPVGLNFGAHRTPLTRAASPRS